MKPLRELLLPDERIAAFVGAGGKTTLILTLAHQLAGWGRRVLVIPTTDTLPPSRNLLLLDSATRIPPYTHLTVGRSLAPDDGRLLGVDPEEIPGLMARFSADFVLVRAGNAGGRPLLVPGAPADAIPPSADLVVAVIGLDALGLAANERTVSGMAEFSRLTGRSRDEAIRPECLDILAGHPQGFFLGSPDRARRLIFHNKADIHDPMGRVFGSARQGWFLERQVTL